LKLESGNSAANHWWQKEERGTSGTFCCPSAFALEGIFVCYFK